MLVEIIGYAELKIVGVDLRLVKVIGKYIITIWGFEWAILLWYRYNKHKPDQIGWYFFYGLSFSNLIDLNINLPSIISIEIG